MVCHVLLLKWRMASIQLHPRGPAIGCGWCHFHVLIPGRLPGDGAGRSPPAPPPLPGPGWGSARSDGAQVLPSGPGQVLPPWRGVDTGALRQKVRQMSRAARTWWFVLLTWWFVLLTHGGFVIHLGRWKINFCCRTKHRGEFWGVYLTTY